MRNQPSWFPLFMVLSLALAACAGAPTSAPGSGTVTALAFDPDDSSLLKADAAGLSRFNLKEKVWKPIATPASSALTAIVVNPDSPGTLYLSGLGPGVMKSTDGGQNWSEINGDLPNKDITALAIHSFRRETLYAWARGEGVYRTENGGAQWKKIPDNLLPFTEAAALVHSTLPGSMNTGWLYASSADGAYLSMDCF